MSVTVRLEVEVDTDRLTVTIEHEAAGDAQLVSRIGSPTTARLVEAAMGAFHDAAIRADSRGPAAGGDEA